MNWQDVRPLAVGVARRDDEFLLAEHHDSIEEETFYRPPGGGIEFGEMSEETLEREFAEELDVALADYRLVETLENTFTFHGEPGHEIWFLYEVTFEESWPYERDTFTGREPELDEEFTLVWMPRKELSETIVYPDELLSLFPE